MSMDNDVAIEIYDGTNRVPDISNDLEFAENILFNTHIPGGDYGDASFFVERDVTDPILFEVGHRIVMLNEQTVVYEGFICGINRVVEDDFQGIEFLCVGATDWYLMKYPLEKRWADSRIGEDAWEWVNGETLSENATVDRNGRIRITPKGVACGLNTQCRLKYTSPIGQTVKRVKFDYDLQEGGQAWEGRVITGGGETAVSRTASGTGTTDHSFSTPHQLLYIDFISRAAQTPTEDGAYYWELTNLVVYSETDNPITMTTVTQDCAAEVGAAGYLNTSTELIGTPGTQLTLEPFITNGYPSIADILNDAVGRGDGAYNRWIWGVRNSDAIPGANGKPILYLEQYPDTTDWEYEVTFGDENIASRIELLQDGLAIANHIITSRTDANGRFVYQTPADDANLADATSKADYRVLAGVRLDCGDCDQAEATAYARRFKATYKDPPFKLLRSLALVDYIRRKDGSEQPVRLIRSGERIKLTNFVTSLSGIEPVFVITAVAHSVADNGVSITTGVPGAPIGARQVLRPVSAPPGDATGGSSTPAAGGSTGGGDRMKFNWWERYWKASGKKRGLTVQEAKAEWNTMQQGKRNAWKKNDWKAWKKSKKG